MSEDLKLVALLLLLLSILSIFVAGELILRRRRQRLIESAMTPFTEQGLTQYDDFAPGEAVILAWSEAGEFPKWHRQMQDRVRSDMPVLGRALDRMVDN